MVILENPNATGASLFLKDKDTISVDTPKTQLTNVSKYFVKDILSILESTDKKGKTKLKEIRRKMYDYLK
jgi:hypothetical protein